MTQERTDPKGRVGVVTIIDHANYGNRLQNYALQQVIVGMGFACTTIDNLPHPEPVAAEAGKGLAAGLRRAGAGGKRLGRRIFAPRRAIARNRERALRQARRASGQAFTATHIRRTDFTLYRDTHAGHVDAMFDFFVAGSDQVWNPGFRKLCEVDFLTFAERRKRIAFSASMGIAELPEDCRSFYRERLAGFEHISVRETAAADVVRGLTGREVPVTIDPTLMLGADEWRALSRRHPMQPAGDYVLTYFLGARPAAAAALTARLAAQGLGVVHLNDRREEAFYAADPAEFLGLIAGARLVLTDSFHGSIFSVILGTPFLAFDRASAHADMGSRLETLLGTLELKHRKIRALPADAELTPLLEADYGHVGGIVARKAAESRAYLAGALGVG